MDNTYFNYLDNNHIARFNLVRIIISIIMITFICNQYGIAGNDLEDGISKYVDDPISKWNQLGEETVNISFIIAEALGRINMIEKDDIIQNSVVVGHGADVGDIYNIHLNYLIPSVLLY